MQFKEELKAKSAKVETYLATMLDSLHLPQNLKEAMNYSLLAGGKRLRPVLLLSCAKMFGLQPNKVLPFAAAIECIHSYSLIHDDLPAMDDDDLRRGKPSNHKKFGEATAILAGDALVTDAFIFMAEAGFLGGVEPSLVLRALAQVARAAGSEGMVGGQMLDMQYTNASNITLADVKKMQSMKTGALIRVSCLAGAILAGADAEDCAKIANYAEGLGTAFQITDDILDEIGDEAVLGKPVGSDAEQGKSTYPALIGLDESRRLAEEAVNSAKQALAGINANDCAEKEFLLQLLEYVLKRAS